MKSIRCHQCACVQSSARDVCIECGAFMKREAQYFVADKEHAQTLVPPSTHPSTSVGKTAPSKVFLSDGANPTPINLPPETMMICCHSCYRVQLAEEFICRFCGQTMQRLAHYMFPAKTLTKPYEGPLPIPLSPASAAPPSASAQQKPINSAVQKPQTQDSIAQTEKAEGLDSKAKTMNICCHQCYAVQDAVRTICEKCSAVMRRDQQYFFSASHKK